MERMRKREGSEHQTALLSVAIVTLLVYINITWKAHKEYKAQAC
jgi:hypothetical protein